MYQKSIFVIFAFIVILLLFSACTPQPEIIKQTVVIKITATPVPRYGIIICMECDGIPLNLWEFIDYPGNVPGVVYHGNRCQILDYDSWEGIAKYKLNCSGKIGWLRAEGVNPEE